MIELLFGLIVAWFVFCLGAAVLYVIFWLPVMAIGGIIDKIAEHRVRRRAAKFAQESNQ